MKYNIISIAAKIEKHKKGMAGVYSYADLCNLIGLGSPLATARIIKRLVRDGLLFGVQKGIYTTAEFDTLRLAGRINPECYISMDTVLAREGLVGTVPKYSFSAVQRQRSRIVETQAGTVRFYSLAEELFFGFMPDKNGVRIADPEKAFLDTLYFYTRGNKFVFDPLKEIAVRKLDQKKINRYLKRYRNPKFVKFTRRVIGENI
ncbi:MAG: hypothetical protein V2A66_08250 [Pseudomonadota bacterium]